jgi:hypothetical protein
MASIDDVRKSRGRPPVNATPVTVRVPPTILFELDRWIELQPDPKPTRPEAIRRLVADQLAEFWAERGEMPDYSDGDGA